VVGSDPDEIIIHPNGKRYRKKPLNYSEKEWFAFDNSGNRNDGPGFDCCLPYTDDVRKLTDRRLKEFHNADQLKEILSEEPIYHLVPESEEFPQGREATPMEQEWKLVVGGNPEEIIIIDGKKYRKIPDGGFTEKQAFSHLPGPKWDYHMKYIFDLRKLAGRDVNDLKVENNEKGLPMIADFSDELLYRLIPLKENSETSL